MSESLYCERSGEGPDLVLLHGWAMNLRVFDALRAELSQRFRVTAIDLPGHGRSSSVGALELTSQLALIAQQVPPGATLIGWSLGGQFALQLAFDSTLALSRLVLISSTPRFVAGTDWPHGLAATTLQRFATQLRQNAAGTISDFLELQVRGSADASAVLATLKQALREQGEASAAALEADLALLIKNDLRAIAATVTLPTLVIAGQYDRVTPPAAGEALTRLLTHAQLRTIARAGHAPFLSHPGEVVGAVGTFLESGLSGAHAGRASA